MWRRRRSNTVVPCCSFSHTARASGKKSTHTHTHAKRTNRCIVITILAQPTSVSINQNKRQKNKPTKSTNYKYLLRISSRSSRMAATRRGVDARSLTPILFCAPCCTFSHACSVPSSTLYSLVGVL